MINTNLIDQYFDKTTTVNRDSEVFRPVNFKSEIPKSETDKLAFLDMYTNMKEISEDAECGAYLEEGQINGQNAFMKIATSYNEKGKQFKLYQEGNIGNKNLSLEMTTKTERKNKNYTFTGEYNNKQFDLQINYPLERSKLKSFWNETVRNRMHVPDEMTISGTIDGKPYELHLPDAKVPRDMDEKDLTTIMLRLSGYDPSVINGKIVSLEPGARRVHSHKHRSEQRQKLYHDPTVSLIIGMTLTPLVAGLTGIAKKIPGVIMKCFKKLPIKP